MCHGIIYKNVQKSELSGKEVAHDVRILGGYGAESK